MRRLKRWRQLSLLTRVLIDTTSYLSHQFSEFEQEKIKLFNKTKRSIFALCWPLKSFPVSYHLFFPGINTICLFSFITQGNVVNLPILSFNGHHSSLLCRREVTAFYSDTGRLPGHVSKCYHLFSKLREGLTE